MSQALAEARLTSAESRIDILASEARGSADDKSRIDRHVEALRKAHASASAAARAAGSRFDDALEELGTRLAIAERRRAAEVADDRDDFVHAVEAELHAWDGYIELLEKRRAAGTTDVSTSELRSRRNEAAKRLGDMRMTPGDTWRERREEVFQALDELDREAGTA
ncbi:MAG TPA: hypothetical protein VHH55_05565 [Gaiellaceae bacterium]|nr:hypothetical protein [Gaiellaceae bacterium]